jgi:hypothetical protein
MIFGCTKDKLTPFSSATAFQFNTGGWCGCLEIRGSPGSDAGQNFANAVNGPFIHQVTHTVAHTVAHTVVT